MTYLAEKIHLKVQANIRFIQSNPSKNIIQSVRNYGIIQNLFQRMVLPFLAYFLSMRVILLIAAFTAFSVQQQSNLAVVISSALLRKRFLPSSGPLQSQTHSMQLASATSSHEL